MTNNNQSSVDWLISQLQKSKDWNRVLNEISQMSSARVDIIEQAKEMRKDEIKNAQMDMFIHLNNLPYGLEYLEKRQSAEDFSQQYYNETYGGNNEQQ